MELSGLNIFKHLPGGKKEPNANCKQCGFATCMAFALKLAQKATTIDKCPYCSQEFKAIVAESFKKQQNEIIFGKNSTKTGGETVLFRHEKTFINKPPIILSLHTDDKDFDKKLKQIADYSVERVGETYKVDGIYLIDNGDLQNKANKVNGAGLGLIIESSSTEECVNLRRLNPIFKLDEYTNEFVDSNIIVKGTTLEELEITAKKLLAGGFTKLVLEYTGNHQTKHKTVIRQRAMQEKFEPFAYPVLTKMQNTNDDYAAIYQASLALCRYSNIIVLEEFNLALLTTLFTLRQNIYADPQKPLQVEPKVYEINEPNEDSMVLLTTNFALSYYAVSNEIESIGAPAYLVVTPADGMSVLTAWSAEKLTSTLVKRTLDASGLADKINTKEIIIPGLLGHLKNELEETLMDWHIIVGPNEAYRLPEFLAEIKK